MNHFIINQKISYEKVFTVLSLLFLSAFAIGQNGFYLTPIEINNISAYTIDEEDNYWITSENNGLYKFDGDTLIAITPEIDISETGFNDVFVDANGVYLVNLSGIFYLHRDDEYTIDTIVNGFVKAATLYENKLVRAASTYILDAPIIEVYENGILISSDTLAENMLFNDVAIYQDTIFLAHTNGLLKYTGEEFIELSNTRTEGIIVWNNQLWTPNGYFYENGKIKSVKSYGNRIGIMNNQLWTTSYTRLFYIYYDHFVEYQMPGLFMGSRLKPFANQNGESRMEYITLDGLVTFNPEEYIADPGYYSANTNNYLDINNVKAMLSTSNSLFWDLAGSGRYEVPKDSGVHSMFATAPWIGGIDQDGQLRVATAKFLQYSTQFFPGPLRIADGETDTVTAVKFHRMWRLDRATVENFKYRFENGLVQNGSWPIHYSISSWPANGPVGYAENLAPFVDYNNDGIYNPMDGDYPEMKGDEMLYWIVNDNLATTNVDNLGENMGVELHCAAWANVYENGDNDTAEAINHTTFLDIEVINRSDRNYHDVYFGIWSDFDLGYYGDDFVGTDVMNHSFYVYNADDFDDEGSSVPGYGENPPAQSVTFLDAPMKKTIASADTGIYLTKFMYHESGGGAYGDQQYAADFYNYMRGHWKDSTTLTYGGTGHDEGNTLECDYMFPGDSDPYFIGTNGIDPEANWTEEAAELESGDRRGIGSNGPFNLDAGESVNFRFVFVWARGTDGAQSSVARLRELLPLVHEWQRTGNFPSNYGIDIVPIGIVEATKNDLGVKIYPNPTNDLVYVECDSENAVYSIYSLSGKLVSSGSIYGIQTIIDVSNLQNDLYLLHVNDGVNGYTKKLIVQ